MIYTLAELQGASCENCLYYTLEGGPFGDCRYYPQIVRKAKADWCSRYVGERQPTPRKEYCPEHDCPGVCCPEHLPSPQGKYPACQGCPESSCEGCPVPSRAAPPPAPMAAPDGPPDGPTAAPTGPLGAPGGYHPPVPPGQAVNPPPGGADPGPGAQRGPVADGPQRRERTYRVEFRSGIIQQIVGETLNDAIKMMSPESQRTDTITSVSLLSEVNLGFKED